jgi:protein-S-isoprenylcysteine O-methyltransferase Ste14
MRKRLYINPILLSIVNFGCLVTLGFVVRVPQSTLIGSSDKVIGCVLFALAITIMMIAHGVQKQAHRKAQDITRLATTGIYSRCRHPIYLAFIVMNVATVFVFGNIWLMIVALPFMVLWHFEARQEEKFLLDKFGDGYTVYMREVPMWNVFGSSRR